MSNKLTALRTAVDWCLRGLGVVVVLVIFVELLHWGRFSGLTPPEYVKDIDSFQEWRQDFFEAAKIENRGSVYYSVTGDFARWLASAKSEYYFDSNGNFLDWNRDPGDFKYPDLFFSDDANRSGISIQDIPGSSWK